MSAPLLSPVIDETTDVVIEPDLPWNTFLWNDPVTPVPVVVLVIQDIFGYSLERAQQLMLTAHRHGKAVVFTGTLHEAEAYCVKLHAAGLQATIAQDS